jgi:transposase
MSDQFWLSEAQLNRIKPCFPRPHGVPRVDDRKVVSGIIHVTRNGFCQRQCKFPQKCRSKIPQFSGLVISRMV